jgi:hypothetical protein
MQYDRNKLRALILYACSVCDRSQLGAVKLHKLLYYTDMVHYAQVGTPVTGSTYRKRQLGPTADSLLPMLRDMAMRGEIRVHDVDYFGFRKKEYEPLAEPDMGLFSGAERALIDEVIDFVCRNNTAKTISDFSHGRAWEIAEFGDELPYHSALHLFPNQVTQEALDWASDEMEAVEAERPQKDPVDYPLFSDLRRRILQEGRI